MDNNTGSITKTIRFYSQGTFFKEWYADLPQYIEEGGNKEDLEMVAGADVLLDILSNEGSEVTIKLSTTEFEDSNKLAFKDDLDGDQMFESGAYYYIDNIDGKPVNDTMWLCDVTAWVFNGFPLYIYYKVMPNDKTHKTN